MTGPARRWQVSGTADVVRLLDAGKQAERIVLSATASLDTTGVAGIPQI